MFKKILVPLDGSAIAEHALSQAVVIAKACRPRAAIDLVLVHQQFPVDGFSDSPWSAVFRTDTAAYLDAISQGVSLNASLHVTYGVLRGEPVDAICRRIEEIDADLVLMSSHGRTGLSRAWFGSVADGVVRNSPVPVLIVRPRAIAGKPDVPPRVYERILIPVDGSDLSAEILPSAISLAECGRGSLALLQVVEPVAAIKPAGDSRFDYVPPVVNRAATQLARAEAVRALSTAASRLREASGLMVDADVVVDAYAATAILDYAAAHAIDAVAMATHGRGISRFLVGSVADKVLRGGHLPTLLFRPLAVQQRERDAQHANAEALTSQY